MKKLVTVLLILLILGLIAPCWPDIAQPLHLPHENPDTASGTPDATDLLLSLSQIFNITANRQYKNAQEVLDELKKSVLPPELQTIADRYQSLSAQILDNLNHIESLIGDAQSSFSIDNSADAAMQLSQAKSALDSTKGLLIESEAVITSLGEYFDIFSGTTDILVKHVYDQLNGNLASVSRLTDELAALRVNLLDNPAGVVTTSNPNFVGGILLGGWSL